VKLRRTTCRHVKNLLPLHVGSDLPARQAGPVEEHLHTCLSCFREYRELTAMRERIGVLTEQPLPEGVLDGFADEIMARIAVGEPGPRAELPLAMERARTWPRYAAAAALLVAVGVGMQTLGVWAPVAGNAPASSALGGDVASADGSFDGGDGQHGGGLASAPRSGAATLPADDLGIYAPPVDDAAGRPLTRPPVYDTYRGTEFAGEESQQLRLSRRAPNVAMPNFTEGARVLVDAAGRQVIQLIPQGGGLQPEFDRELRPREP